MLNVVTHNRFFNLDEVAAIALLDIFLLKGDYNLIRTRDEKILKEHQNSKKSYVIDVGFKFEKDNLNFDHHQKSMNKTWQDGTPFSSCGLIWEYLKENNYINLPMRVIQKFESSFVKKVDAQDNGIQHFKEMSFVNDMNRNHHDNDFIDLQFNRALKQVVSFINISLVNIDNKKKNLFSKHSNVNSFLDKLMSVALLRNFGFSKKFSFNIENNLCIFNFINLKNKDDVIILDFDKNTFSLGDEVTFVNDFMTLFVWRFLIEKNLLTHKMNDETVEIIQDKIISPFKTNSVLFGTSHIAMFENSNEPIFNAYSGMNSFVVNTFSEIRGQILANKKIKKIIDKSKDLDGIVFADENIKSAPLKIANLCDDKKLIVFPRDKKSWKIQVIPNNNSNSFSKNISMPKEWCGLSGDRLVNISMIKGLIFCHKAGFMCMFEGTKEDAIKLAKDIINY